MVVSNNHFWWLGVTTSTIEERRPWYPACIRHRPLDHRPSSHSLARAELGLQLMRGRETGRFGTPQMAVLLRPRRLPNSSTFWSGWSVTWSLPSCLSLQVAPCCFSPVTCCGTCLPRSSGRLDVTAGGGLRRYTHQGNRWFSVSFEPALMWEQAGAVAFEIRVDDRPGSHSGHSGCSFRG